MQQYNAADKALIKKKSQLVKNKIDTELSDLKTVLSTPQGRRVMWRILSKCQVYASIWRQSAEIHYLAGKQDIGHFIIAEITKADPEAYMVMMRENMELEKKGKE